MPSATSPYSTEALDGFVETAPSFPPRETPVQDTLSTLPQVSNPDSLFRTNTLKTKQTAGIVPARRASRHENNATSPDPKPAPSAAKNFTFPGFKPAVNTSTYTGNSIVDGGPSKIVEEEEELVKKAEYPSEYRARYGSAVSRDGGSGDPDEVSADGSRSVRQESVGGIR